jgi:hypothetical protein
LFEEPSIYSENNKSVAVELPAAAVVTFTVLLALGIFPAAYLAFKEKEKAVEAVSPVIVVDVLDTVVFKALFKYTLYPLTLILLVEAVQLSRDLNF